MSSGTLQGKRALVTGVTSGIGQATTAALLREGVTVYGVGRDQARLSRATRELGASFHPLLCDLSSPPERKRLVGELSRLGPLDILVNNAAECIYERPLDVSPAVVSRLFEVNVTATLELVQAVAGAMEAGSHVVQLSSVVARHLPAAKFATYAATKAALDCFSEALRLELHPRGVRVSTLAPGLVDTPIYDKVSGFERARTQLREQIPVWLSATDVADALIWILSRPPHLVVSDISLLPSRQPR